MYPGTRSRVSCMLMYNCNAELMSASYAAVWFGTGGIGGKPFAWIF